MAQLGIIFGIEERVLELYLVKDLKPESYISVRQNEQCNLFYFLLSNFVRNFINTLLGTSQYVFSYCIPFETVTTFFTVPNILRRIRIGVSVDEFICIELSLSKAGYFSERVIH